MYELSKQQLILLSINTWGKTVSNYYNIITTGSLGHYERLYNLLRMDPGMFHFILDGIQPLIIKKDTNYRKAISPGERLALTLRFLATGIMNVGFLSNRVLLGYNLPLLQILHVYIFFVFPS